MQENMEKHMVISTKLSCIAVEAFKFKILFIQIKWIKPSSSLSPHIVDVQIRMSSIAFKLVMMRSVFLCKLEANIDLRF